ncbi:MAG: HEAT repeat domain-containing protein [Planctomycetales bacterium]
MTNGGIFNRWYRNGACLAFCLLVMITSSVAQSADADHRYDLDYWIGKLRSDSQEDQHTALFRLHFSGSATLPALSAYEHVIRTSNVENRVSALKIVAQLGPTAQSAVPTVRKALKSSHGKVRRAAAFCVLSVVGEDDEAIAVMSELLRNGNSDDRRDVASDLWIVGIPARACVPALVEATQDSDEEVRRQAAKALGRIGHVPGNVSRGPLKLLLGDESPVIRFNAARSLWQLDEPVPSFLPTLIESSELKPYRNDEDEKTQWQRVSVRHALLLMAEIGPESKAALPVLMKAALSKQLGAKLAAVEALGPEARPALDVLATALHDPSVEAIPFSHRSSSVYGEAATTALQRIGPPSISVLIDVPRAACCVAWGLRRRPLFRNWRLYLMILIAACGPLQHWPGSPRIILECSSSYDERSPSRRVKCFCWPCRPPVTSNRKRAVSCRN